MQGHLAEVRVVLHQLQALSCVALVLRGGVIALTILGAYDTDDFASFCFFSHGGPESFRGMPVRAQLL